MTMKNGEEYVFLIPSNHDPFYFKKVPDKELLKCAGSEVFDETDVTFTDFKIFN